MCIGIVEIWFEIAIGYMSSPHDTIMAGYYCFAFLFSCVYSLNSGKYFGILVFEVYKNIYIGVTFVSFFPST